MEKTALSQHLATIKRDILKDFRDGKARHEDHQRRVEEQRLEHLQNEQERLYQVSDAVDPLQDDPQLTQLVSQATMLANNANTTNTTDTVNSVNSVNSVDLSNSGDRGERGESRDGSSSAMTLVDSSVSAENESYNDNADGNGNEGEDDLSLDDV